MPRLLFCSLLAASLATIAPAAPVPTHLMPKEVPFVFPTNFGTTWIYEVDGKEKTLVISRSEDQVRGRHVTTEWVLADGKRALHWELSVMADGVYLLNEGGLSYDPPMCLVKSPHREGQAWKMHYKWPGIQLELDGVITAGRVERVKVPAGEFNATRLDWEYTLSGVLTTNVTSWYVHGIGLVQEDGLKLKSFKPGK